MEVSQQQLLLLGGHYRFYLAGEGCHSHRSPCKLCLGWGFCWLVHGEHSITQLWYG